MPTLGVVMLNDELVIVVTLAWAATDREERVPAEHLSTIIVIGHSTNSRGAGGRRYGAPLGVVQRLTQNVGLDGISCISSAPGMPKVA